MIVVDASVVLEVLLRTTAGDEIADRLFSDGETLHTPHLIDLEVAQVTRRYWLNGDLDEKRGREILADLADLRIERYPHMALLPRIWELKPGVTAYDAAYLALAEVLDAPLLTRDARLAAASGHRARIELA